MRKMRAEIQKLRSKPLEVVKEIYVEVEKIVDCLVFTEADVEAAFEKWAELAMACMCDFKKTIVAKYKDILVRIGAFSAVRHLTSEHLMLYFSLGQNSCVAITRLSLLWWLDWLTPIHAFAWKFKVCASRRVDLLIS